MGMKLSLLAGGSLLFLVIMGNAIAECPVSADVQIVDFGKVIPFSDVPVGGVLAEAVVNSSADAMDCTEGRGLNIEFSGQDAGQMAYSTGIAGIGYRIKHNQMPLTIIMPQGGVQIGNAPEFVVQLVKTQEKAGTGSVSASARMSASDVDNRPVIALDIRAAVGTTTCDLTTPDVAVQLPTLDTSAFAGRGTTAGMTDFSIELYCYDGSTIDITFEPSDPVNSLSALGVLAATAEAGSATGVGAQLLFQGAPVNLQSALNLPQQSGALTLPFQVSYYQMADEVSAGQLRAMATFSLSYQ